MALHFCSLDLTEPAIGNQFGCKIDPELPHAAAVEFSVGVLTMLTFCMQWD